MSVDETLLCSFQVRHSGLERWRYLNTLTNGNKDPQAGREEGEVPVRWCQYGAACYTTTQTEEEGCEQDGLNTHPVSTSFPSWPDASHTLFPFIVSPWSFSVVLVADHAWAAGAAGDWETGEYTADRLRWMPSCMVRRYSPGPVRLVGAHPATNSWRMVVAKATKGTRTHAHTLDCITPLNTLSSALFCTIILCTIQLASASVLLHPTYLFAQPGHCCSILIESHFSSSIGAGHRLLPAHCQRSADQPNDPACDLWHLRASHSLGLSRPSTLLLAARPAQTCISSACVALSSFYCEIRSRTLHIK